jgi:hypothetical protein
VVFTLASMLRDAFGSFESAAALRLSNGLRHVFTQVQATQVS